MIVLCTHNDGGVVKPEQYDHVILDMDRALQHSVEIILGSQPDIVLVPVNASQKIKALRNLSRTLNVIAQLAEKTGHSPKTIIVPLGVPIEDVQAVLQQTDLQNLNWRLAPSMPNLQDLIQLALYQDRQYIWHTHPSERFKMAMVRCLTILTKLINYLMIERGSEPT